MPLNDLAGWVIFVHVAAAFAFAAGHGVSIFVAFRVRRERDARRIGALLDVSTFSLMTVAIALVTLLVSGILAGIMLGSFGRLWIWVSLGLLIAIALLMTPVGAMYYTRVRKAIGQRTRDVKEGEPDPVPVPPEELERLLSTRRPEILLLLGGGGFLVVLWLMMFRPF